MTPEQKNEEAHGLWELQAARLSGAVEMLVRQEVVSGPGVRTSPVSVPIDVFATVKDCLHDERVAYQHWREVLTMVIR